MNNGSQSLVLVLKILILKTLELIKFFFLFFLIKQRTPHPLVFAKIKGFPYWPAKALKSVGTIELDVRFFGAHDRSLVPIDKCYWLSKELPANVRNHTMVNMQPSLQELNTHIKKLELKFGQFRYAPPLMTIDLNEPFVFIDTFKGKKKRAHTAIASSTIFVFINYLWCILSCLISLEILI